MRLKHSSKTNPGWLTDKKTNTENRNKEKMNQLAPNLQSHYTS